MKLHDKEKKDGGLVVWVLAVSFALSIITLVIYIAETDFSDETLFFLLDILRYSSFSVCVCSIFLLIIYIVRIIHSPSLLSALGIVLSFCFALYGAGIIIIEAIIISFTGGNL